jgi:hypothetical protein
MNLEVKCECHSEEVEKFDCSICEDKGFITKTEWSGDDEDYEVTFPCECSQD